MHNEIQKNNIDLYLKELSKEFRKITQRKVHAEIVLVGGAAIILNYDFRMKSIDVDAINTSNEAMKQASKAIAEKYNLPSDWFNDDFKKTVSYSPKIREYSKYYKTYSNAVEIRTITREYLIAMKMASGRKYKNDLSDILGILYHHYKINDEITLDEINTAIINLYGERNIISDEVKNFVVAAIESKSFIEGYERQKANEISIKSTLIEFENTYPEILNSDNIDEIINNLEND